MFARLREWWRARRLARSRGKDCPSPITFSAETNNGENLPYEDHIRTTELIITRTHAGGVNESSIIAKANFDTGYDDASSHHPVLVNSSILRGVQPDGFFERFPNPEDSPHDLVDSSGKKMKAYGQFYAKIGPCGVATEYEDQQIFLNPSKYMPVLCVAVEETCPFEILVGKRSIREHSLSKPVRTTVAVVGGHDGQSPIDKDARNEKILVVNDQKKKLASIQDAKEEKARIERKQARKSNSAKK